MAVDGAENAWYQTALNNSVVELIANKIEYYMRLAASGITVSDAGVIAFGTSATMSAAGITAGTLAVARGGTGLSTVAAGALLYASALDTLAALTIGSNNTVLRSNGTVPSWGSIVNAHIDAAAAIVFSKLEQGSALSVLGVTGNAAAAVAAIAAGTDNQVLRRSGTALAFGAVNLASSDAITGDLPYANLTPSGSASRLLGRGSASSGDWQEVSLGSGLSMSGTTLSATGTVDVSGTPSDNQIAVWVDADTLEGASGLTYNGTTFTTPGQIAFPATQSASSNVNTLDDYEEGTWTPVIGGEGGTSGQSYTTQNGRYVKIGKLVMAGFYVELSAEGTITGNCIITGLPFTAASSTQRVYLGACTCENLATNWVSFSLQVVAASTTAVLRGRSAAAASDSALTATDIGNTTVVYGTLVYEANA